MKPSSSISSSERVAADDLWRLAAWTFAVIARFAPVVLVAAGLVWFARPAKGEPPVSEERIADAFHSGRDMSGLTRWDPRLVQRYFIARLRERRDVVVFGSSRGWLIQGASFPDRTFFNNSVPLADLEDFVAIYWMYRQAGVAPRLAILSVDPWMFQYDSGNSAWWSIAPEFRAGMRLIRPGGRNPFANIDVASPPGWMDISLVQRSVRQLWNPEPAALAVVSGTERADGSLVRVIRRAVIAQVAIAQVAPGGLYFHWLAFPRVSDRRVKIFEGLVRLMQSDGVTVQLLLSPFHPAAWPILQRDPQYGAVPGAEQTVLDVGRRLRVAVVGSYDPGVCGVDESQFADAVHIAETATNHVLFECPRSAGAQAR